MSAWRIATAVTIGIGFSSVACGGGDERPKATTGTSVGGSGDGSGGTGGSSGAAGADGSAAGGADGGSASGAASSGGSSNASGGSSNAGGSDAGGSGANSSSGGAGGASEPDPVCGNEVLEAGEECEPEGPAPGECVEAGFETGTLGCSADCRYDVSDCDGTERCYDARDNDGDGNRDCEDEDCEETCASSCDVTAVLTDGDSVAGNNRGHAAELQLSCAPSEHGSEVVYAVEVAEDGILDAILVVGNFPHLSVAIRTTCDDDASELACAEQRASAEVSAGDTVYVVVQGVSEADQGAYELYVRSRAANVCGDFSWDPGESCEDGDQASGDGCDGECQVEASEVEPNDNAAGASVWVEPFYAEVSPAGDVDFIEITVEEGPASVIANIDTLAAEGCSLALFDPYIELIDADGETVIHANDDYDGVCSKLVAEGLDAGAYYLRVSESPYSVALRSEFPYQLRVNIDWCGNGTWGPLEECDDGNTDDLDGCSATCEEE